MAKIIRLEGNANYCFGYVDDCGRVWEMPFFSHHQAKVFHVERHGTSEIEKDIRTYDMERSTGAPAEYRFFALKNHGPTAVVVWGPYGLLPHLSNTLAAAGAAARQDLERNSTLRPLSMTNV